MENNMYRDWLKIISKFDGKEELTCPDCRAMSINYQFVGDCKTMIGHLYLWCNSCLHGIHISRVIIPNGVEVLPFDVSEKILSKKVPKYKLIE
jgi:hypothetical protein